MKGITSDLIGKARRNAQRAKTKVACVPCLAYGHRCSESRPCKKCIKSNRDCVSARDVFITNSEPNFSTAVERPLQFKSIMTLDKSTANRINGCPGFGWAFAQIRRFTSLGYRVEFLEQLFSSLSIFECSEINDAIDNTRGLFSITSQSGVEWSDSSRFQVVSEDTKLQCDGGLCLSEMEGSNAIICTSLDPSSSCRTILANPSHAALFGVHCEEFLARAASSDLVAPFSECDALLIILHNAVVELDHGQAPSVIYMRQYIGPSRQAALASIRSTLIKDEQGRVIKVRVRR